MNKLLISVFESDEAAYDGLAALRELDRNGDITLYTSTVVTKDPHGRATVRDDSVHPPREVLVGAAGGTLLGLVGGPVGAVIGGSAGAIGGAVYDQVQAGTALDAADDASRALEPGTAAIVANIDEDWTTPIDTRLGALGATSIRRSTAPPAPVHGAADAAGQSCS